MFYIDAWSSLMLSTKTAQSSETGICLAFDTFLLNNFAFSAIDKRRKYPDTAAATCHTAYGPRRRYENDDDLISTWRRRRKSRRVLPRSAKRRRTSHVDTPT